MDVVCGWSIFHSEHDRRGRARSAAGDVVLVESAAGGSIVDELTRVRLRRAAEQVMRAGLQGGEAAALRGLKDANAANGSAPGALVPVLMALVRLTTDGLRRELATPEQRFDIKVAHADGTSVPPQDTDSGVGLVARAIQAEQVADDDRVHELIHALLDHPDQAERARGVVWLLQAAIRLAGTALARDGHLPDIVVR